MDGFRRMESEMYFAVLLADHPPGIRPNHQEEIK
jgi:hypothetical protein